MDLSLDLREAFKVEKSVKFFTLSVLTPTPKSLKIHIFLIISGKK